MPANERLVVQVDAIGNFSNVIGEVGKFKTQLQGLKLPDKLTAKLEKGFDNVESKVAHFQSLLNKGITTKGDFSKLVSSARSAETAINGLKEDIRSIGDKDIQIAVANSADVKKAEEALHKILNMEKQLSSFGTSKGQGSFGEKEVANMQKLANTSEGLRKRFQDVQNSIKSGNIDQANAALERLIAHAQKYQAIAEKNGKDTSKWDSTIKWAQGAQTQIDGLVTKANQAKAAFEQMQTNKFNQMKTSVDGIATGFSKVASNAKQAITATTEMANRTNQLNEQVGHLRTQANYFFGLQNMGRLIARGIREAAESVRDLDKAMTETAVVTDFSVGDMWNMLPEYTKLANKLGATTQGAYETMTLYFQQGLDKQQTFEIGEETMKMARIAGLDYAQTTNMMTAALRGFNMELNQTSAKRVNDVYSELAAITASDTRELGLAMERTASIAHSANMDFGNTTAFLAQMIETTREAPENLGTAMKTIIARFQELKANPYEISEVEGEEVDFNRVDKALKSIGVDLMDNRDKFRDLDDVFLDISSRWDGLSQTQQRYIATIAAGARQQSRFLAMVQNYDRLKELTDAAANSEGASEVQFSKTLESYEAKVNKLKNAWQAFTMSLANNKAVKGGVDMLQKLITFGNKIIETFGKAGKAIGGDFGKGLGEMLAAFGLGAAGFKGLQFGANAGLGMLAKMTTGSKMGGKFFMGRSSSSSANSAEAGMLTSRITNPIVNAINNLATALGKGKVAAAEQGVRADEINQRRNNLYGMLTEERLDMKGNKVATPSLFSAQDVRKQLEGLSKEEQLAIQKSTPIISNALKNSFKGATNKLNLSKEAQVAADKYYKDINSAVSKGQITYAQGLRKAFNPVSMGESIGGPIGEEIIKKAAEASGKYNSAKYTEKFRRQALAKGLTNDKDIESFINKKRIISASKDPNNMMMGLDKSQASVSKLEAKMSGVTRAASGAGQAVMGLGMALSSAGFTGAGTILMTVGNGLVGIGMAASGASAALTKMGAALKAISSNPALLLNPIGLAVAGLTALTVVGVKAVKKHNDNIKNMQKESKKVLSDYEDGMTKTTRNISKLTEYKDTYKKLSLGVDSNNNNISLGTAEYEDYLQIINDIAKMHPEMVKGYNAHGQAILKETDAVNKAIEAEKRQQQTLEENFTTSDNLDKLIAGRNTTKRWQVGQDGSKSTNGYIDTTKQSKLKTDSQAVIDAIQNLKGGDQLLAQMADQFGIQASDFTNLSDAGIRVIQEHGANMLEQVQTQFNDASDKTTQGLVKNVQDSIAQVGKDTTGIEEVIEPIYKSLSTYASKEGYFDNIPDEFREAAEKGIKEVAKLTTGEDGMTITGKEMQQRVQQVVQEIENLNGHSSEYTDALASMDEAQAQFVKDLDTEAYGTAIADEIEELSKWRDQALDIYKETGNESQRLIAESLQNQIEAYDNFTSESTKTLADGLNEQAAQLEKASNASESFKKKTEGINDYYTGAENMRSILDEIKDGVDDVGKGSRTFWAGAEELLGENYIKNNNFDKVNKQLENVKGMFYDAGGEALKAKDSADQFLTYLFEHQTDDIKGNLSGQFKEISDVLNVTEGKFDFEKARGLSAEQFSDLADSLGMSDQLLASMLNKAAQFYNIDFSNVDVLREALATGGASIAGTEKVNGNTALYTKKSSFETEAMAEGYTPPELDNLEKQLKDKGVKLLSDASDMGMTELKNSVKDMGIKSGQEFIKNFSDLGYSKDEVQSLYDKLLGSGEVSQALKDKINLGDETFGEAYNKMLDERDWEEDKSAEESTADSSAQTASNTSAILAALGGLNVDQYDKGANGKEGLGYQALQKVLGKDGQDTLAQGFATGIDYKSGNALTEQQYQNTYNKLLGMQKDYNDQAALLRLQAQKTEDANEAARFQRQADWYQKAADYTEGYIKQGEEAHQKKLQQDEEENKSEDAKTQNKIENDEQQKNSNKNKTDSEKGDQEQLSDTYKNYLDSLNAMEMGQEGQQLLTPDQLAKKFGLSDEDIADYQNRYQQLQQQLASNTYSDMGLSQEQGDLLGLKKAFVDGQTDLTNFKNTFSQVTSALGPNLQLTKEQLGQIKQNISGLDGKQLNNLNTQQLLKDLKLDNKQIEALKAANIDIPIKTDDKNLDNTKKKKDDLEKPVEVPVKAKNTSNIEAEVKKTKDNASKNTTTTTTTNNSVTLNTTVANPEEPKQKIDAAMPKNYSTTVKASISMSASVSAKGLASKMQAKADSASKGLKVKTGTSAKITASVSGEKNVKNLNSAIAKTKGKTVKVKADVSGKSQVDSLKNAISNLRNKTVTVTYKQKGKPGDGGSVGINNHISYQSPIHANSLATGTLGNKRRKITDFKGGLTLTGEKGFEIAWLPSENRSMILGAQGPQMINLPKDAVVWTNEQSKKIMKQKAIPAASMVGGGGTWGGGSGSPAAPAKSNKSGGKKEGTHKGPSKSSDNGKKQTREIIKYGKITSWVFNMEQKIAQVKRKQEEAQKKLNKQLEIASNTLKDITTNGNEDIKRLKQSITLNKQLADHYTKQLKKLDKKGKTTITWSNPTEQRTKKNGKWGKWKKSSDKKHTSSVNLGSYIKFDEATGAYVVDYEKINKNIGQDHKNKKGKTVKGDKNKAKAVKEAAEKAISENTSKRDSALSAYDEAKDKLEELGKQLADTFYNWENELTRIYHLSQKLETQGKKTERFKGVLDLQEAIISSGLKSNFKNTIKFFKDQLTSMVSEINSRAELIQEQIKDIKNLQSSTEIGQELQSIEKKLKGDSDYKKTKNESAEADKKVAADNKAINAAKVAAKKSTKQAVLENKKLAAQKKVKKAQDKINKANTVLKNKNASKKDKNKAKKAKTDATKEKNAAKDSVKALNTKIKKEKTANKKLSTTQKISKEKNLAQKQANIEKALRKKRSTQQKKIDAANKILKNKKSSEKEKKQAQKELKAAKAEKAKLNKQIKNANTIKKAANKRKNTLQAGETARKNLTKDKNNAKAKKTAVTNAKDNDISETRRIALEARKKELKEQRKILQASQKYVTATSNKDGTIELKLDYDKLNKDKQGGLISQKLYEAIKKYYDDLTEKNNKLNELYIEQMSALADVYEMVGDFKEQYADRSEELLDMTEEAQEKEIDKLQKLNDSLEKAIKNLLDEVKRKLDERRKAEDNAKTEQDISKKQQRLAALRADTSGGHQVEIAQLEQEIAEAQQAYQRTLEDQLLDRLQNQADKAAEQRDRQIELLNQQLDFAKATGTNVALVNEYLKNPKKYQKEIQELWKAGKDYDNQTDARKEALDIEWDKFWNDISSSGGLQSKIEELNKTIQQLRGVLLTTVIAQLRASHPGETVKLNELIGQSGMTLEELQAATQESGLTFKDLMNQGVGLGTAATLKGVNKDNPSDKTLKAVHDAGWSATSTADVFKNTTYGQMRTAGYDVYQLQKVDKFKKTATNSIQKSYNDLLYNRGNKTKTGDKNWGKIGKDAYLAQVKRGKALGKSEYKVAEDLAKTAKLTWVQVLKAAKAAGRKPKTVKAWNPKAGKASNFRKAFEKVYGKWSKFAKGGLADYTGPAWLDGTPSKPELVLNAADTQNFLALKDVLSKAVNSSDSVSNSYGDAIFEINVNVDHISNDYDVDKIVTRVKKDITKSANYRNVTQVRNFR